jgi:hypothetical protein
MLGYIFGYTMQTTYNKNLMIFNFFSPHFWGTENLQKPLFSIFYFLISLFDSILPVEKRLITVRPNKLAKHCIPSKKTLPSML